jgi:DNA-binding SARP family transcriptional activator/Tfp pilus assembly protein PilF
MDSGLTYRLFGPVEAVRDGRPVPIPGAKQRTLLAALLVRANRVVSAERLIAWLWAHDPPADARNALQNHVKRLRRVLVGEGGRGSVPDPITTHPDGYLMALPEQALDLSRFTGLVRRAETAAAAGRPRDAVALYDEALAQWRGEPLGDISSVSLRGEYAGAFTERRLAAVEARIELELRLGRHVEVLAELAGLTAAQPLRERFWEQRLLALYRSGRQAEALAAYQSAAAVLAEELGIDPGTALRELHQAILTDAPAVRAPRAVPAARSAAGGPRQLPPAVSRFTGRGAELEALDELLASGLDAAASRSTCALVVIDGPAGVGKTALGVHWSQRLRARYPDGQIYLNLRGYGPTEPVAASAALDAVLRALGLPAEQVPATDEERTAALRSATTDRRFLFLLDNACDVRQIRPLLPGPGCLTVVTSRSQLRGLSVRDGAHRLAVRPIGADEGMALLSAVAGREASGFAEQDVRRLVGRCAGLPLAILIVAERLARDRRGLEDVLRDLDDADSRLDLLSSADDELSDMRAVLSWSSRTLDPEAARALRLIGAQPGPDITLPAAAALLGLPPERVAPILDRLVSVHLLEARPPDRYQLHDLLRAYAAELSAQHPEDAQDVRRLLDWYLAAAAKASRAIHPRASSRKILIPAGAASLPRFADANAALDWFDSVRLPLDASIDAAIRLGLVRHAWTLAWTMWDYFEHRGRFDDYVATYLKGLDAARRAESRLGERHMHSGLAKAYGRLRKPDAAMWHASAALEIARESGGPRSEAAALAGLADVHALLGEEGKSLRARELALETYTRLGDVGGQFAMLNNLAAGLILRRQTDEALAYLHRSRALIEQTGQGRDLGIVLRNLGVAHAGAGRHETALEHYRQSLDLDRDRGLLRRQARTLCLMAESFEALGDLLTSHEHLTRARAVYQEAGQPATAEITGITARLAGLEAAGAGLRPGDAALGGLSPSEA